MLDYGGVVVKLRNARMMFKSKESQVIDPTASEGYVPARRYRRYLNRHKNRPLFRGSPILTRVYLEARA